MNDHICEVPEPPTSLEQTWDCDRCGKHFRAFDILTETRIPGIMHKRIKPGQLGWTTRKRET